MPLHFDARVSLNEGAVTSDDDGRTLPWAGHFVTAALAFAFDGGGGCLGGRHMSAVQTARVESGVKDGSIREGDLELRKDKDCLGLSNWAMSNTVASLSTAVSCDTSSSQDSEYSSTTALPCTSSQASAFVHTGQRLSVRVFEAALRLAIRVEEISARQSALLPAK